MKEVDGIKEVVEIKEVDEIIVAYYDITNRIFTFRDFSVCSIHALVRLKTELSSHTYYAWISERYVSSLKI